MISRLGKNSTKEANMGVGKKVVKHKVKSEVRDQKEFRPRSQKL